MKSFHFQCLKLWEYPVIIFWFKFRVFAILIILIFWFYIYFWKMLIDYQKLALLSKTIKNSKGFNSVEFITFVWNHDGRCYHIEISPLICRANQWTGFYMITASVIKELNNLANINTSEIFLSGFIWKSWYLKIFFFELISQN